MNDDSPQAIDMDNFESDNLDYIVETKTTDDS